MFQATFSYEEQEFIPLPPPIKLVAFSPDGSLVATATTDRRLEVSRGAERLYSLDLHSWHDRFRALDRIRAIAFSPDSRTLHVASGETLFAFDARTRTALGQTGRLPTFAFLITCPQSIACSPLGTAVAYDDGWTEIYAQESIKKWFDNDGPRLIAFLQDGRRLAGTDFVSTCIWDAETGEKLYKYLPDDKVFAIATSPTDDLIAIRTLHELEILRAGEHQPLARVAVPAGLPTLAFHPQKPLVACGSARRIDLHSLDGVIVESIACDGFAPLSLAFSPDGSVLAVGCSDGELRVQPISS